VVEGRGREAGALGTAAAALLERGLWVKVRDGGRMKVRGMS
jgi:hypothetical protein